MNRLLQFLATTSIAGGMTLAAPIVKADTTYLVLGTYSQPHGTGKPMVAQYSSPSVQVIPMESIEQCETAGRQITNTVYKPIWYFDGRWTCVEGK